MVENNSNGVLSPTNRTALEALPPLPHNHEIDIFCNSGSSSLADNSQNLHIIASLAQKIHATSGVVGDIEIIGFSDATGLPEAKKKISDARAKVVKEALETEFARLGVTNVTVEFRGDSDHDQVAGGNDHNRYTAIKLNAPAVPPAAAAPATVLASPAPTASEASPPPAVATVAPSPDTPSEIGAIIADTAQKPDRLNPILHKPHGVLSAIEAPFKIIGHLLHSPHSPQLLDPNTVASLVAMAKSAQRQGMDSINLDGTTGFSTDLKMRRAQQQAIRSVLEHQGIQKVSFDPTSHSAPGSDGPVTLGTLRLGNAPPYGKMKAEGANVPPDIPEKDGPATGAITTPGVSLYSIPITSAPLVPLSDSQGTNNALSQPNGAGPTSSAGAIGAASPRPAGSPGPGSPH